MTSAISDILKTGIVGCSLLSMVPGPYPKIVAEKIGNAAGWGVTTVWNTIRGPKPISETTITTISDLATRVKGLPLLSTTGEKINTFINSKSSTEKQNKKTLQAIGAAAVKAQFPHPEDTARIMTFKAKVEEILVSNAATLSWSDLFGFGVTTVLQPGLIWIPRAYVLLYAFSWIPSDNSVVWGTTALGVIAGYSYLLRRYAGPDLEAQNSNPENGLQPLKNAVIELIKTQAMEDFSLKNKMGGPDAMYSENLTTLVNELKEIGKNKPQPQQTPSSPHSQAAPPAAQPKLEPRQATPVRSNTSQAAPLVSSKTSQSKMEVQAPDYMSLNRTKIAQWSNKIAIDLQFRDDLTPDDAIAFLKEQLGVIKNYLGKAVQAEDGDLEDHLIDFRNTIKELIDRYQRQIDDAKAATRRSAVVRRLDGSF